MSLGGRRYYSACDNTALKPIIGDLRAAGVATIIASGNNGYSDSTSSPGCISTAITVGATTKSDAVAVYSNEHVTMVDLYTLGGSINSSIPTDTYAYIQAPLWQHLMLLALLPLFVHSCQMQQ